MANVIRYRPRSEDLERLTRGWVTANRIADITAKPTSKRHQKYLELVQGQLTDPHLSDPDEVWRHKDLVPRALDGYAAKHGCEPTEGLLYAMPDYRIAAAPHAVDGVVGITVHCRRTLETYEDAVAIGITHEMDRHAQAMMWVTGLKYWIHLDYFEDPEQRIRKLYEHDLYANVAMQELLGDAMVNFYQRSVLRAARSA